MVSEKTVRVVASQIEQTRGTYKMRYFVEVVEGDMIHDIQNFDSYEQALDLKARLIKDLMPAFVPEAVRVIANLHR